MGHLSVLPMVAQGINVYFPIAILLLCLGTYFKLGSRILHELGIDQFLTEDEMTGEMVQAGKSLVPLPISCLPLPLPVTTTCSAGANGAEQTGPGGVSLGARRLLCQPQQARGQEGPGVAAESRRGTRPRLRTRPQGQGSQDFENDTPSSCYDND